MSNDKPYPIELWICGLFGGVVAGIVLFQAFAAFGNERGVVFLIGGPIIGMCVGFIWANNRFDELKKDAQR